MKRESKFVGQRQNIENTKSAAQQRLSAVWIPRKTDTRLKIPQGGIAKQRRSDSGLGIGHVAQYGRPVVRFGGRGHHFVAQTQVQDQTPLQANIILRIGTEKRFPHSNVRGKGCGVRFESCRLIGEKLR